MGDASIPIPAVAVTLGLGCDRGTPLETVEQAVQLALAQAGVPMAAVVAAASIEAKADEVAFLALTRARGWPLRLYSAQALSEVPVPNPSETVRRYMGTPSVSEAAAMLAAGTRTPTDLLVEKFKCKGGDGKNATVSVARVAVARCFSESDREVVHALMQSRRDMRRFVPGATVDAPTRQRLLEAAQTAPSVGLMQPWRFIRVTDTALRECLAVAVDAERLRTAAVLGSRAEAFLALKVEGLRECAELWAVVLAPDDGTVFGRRTMPQAMAWCSVGAAVQNLWLAARAENLGLGWVSLFEPQEVAPLLAVPTGAEVLGLLCIGPVPRFDAEPMLSLEGWRHPRGTAAFMAENTWPLVTGDVNPDVCF